MNKTPDDSLISPNKLNNINLVNANTIALLQDLPVAVYACDTEGFITFYNTAAVSLWGREPVLGKEKWCGSWKIFKGDGSPVSNEDCFMAEAIKERKDVKTHELIIERPDGSRSFIMPRPKLIYDDKGELTGAINILSDITEKRVQDQLVIEDEKMYRELSGSLERMIEKRTENLRKSEERYHKMIEEVQDYAILSLDPDGNILTWNKGAEKIKGYKEEEIIGKNFRTFYLPDDRERKLPDTLLARAADTGRANHEGWRLRKDGSKFWGSVVLTALHDDEDNIVGFTKVTRDLTERKLAEIQLKQYAHDIELQNKKLEEFVYVASHDLQEPLRKIMTFADMMQNNIHDEETVKKGVNKILSSAQRMSNLIKDILKFSRVTKTDELFSETDLNIIFSEVVDSFSLLISQKNVKINKSTLPVINCIPIHLYQLFSNLLSNAIKFNDKIEPEIIVSSQMLNDEEIQHHELSNYRNYYKIIFEDNGSGFKQEYADQIFKLFKRFSDTEQGTGIGLALCKQIVETHKGKIEVKSTPGLGTRFEIILPNH